MTTNRLHTIFIFALSGCLAYGCWLYVSHYLVDGHYKKIRSTQLLQPATITRPYEASLTRTLTGNDHWALQGMARVKKDLLQTSITPKVLIGREGWLFLQEENGKKVLEQSLGVYRYPPMELKAWTLNIRQRNFWAHKYGMDYVLVIAPNKSTIYPEYLPSAYHSLDQPGSRAELINALPEITIVDLTDSIRQRKTEGLLYYKTDSHWNNLGAYFGYRALMQQLPAPYADTPMLRADIRTGETKRRSGDLNRMLLHIANQPEQINDPVPISPKAESREEKAESALQKLNTLVFSQPDTTLPSVFFDHDSYFLDCEPLFAEHFSESTFLWGFQDFHADLIRSKKVDLIVDEFIERALIGPTPRHEWPVIQEYWVEYFEELEPFSRLKGLNFSQLTSALRQLEFPENKIPILKISSQPTQTDKLVIEYDQGTGYYWLREEGDNYYVEYVPGKIRDFRVENGTPCTIQVEIRLY